MQVPSICVFTNSQKTFLSWIFLVILPIYTDTIDAKTWFLCHKMFNIHSVIFFPQNLPLFVSFGDSLILLWREGTASKVYLSLTLVNFWHPLYLLRVIFQARLRLTLLILLTLLSHFPVPVTLFWIVRGIKALPRSCYGTAIQGQIKMQYLFMISQ